jgi:hypothetical protein
MHQNSLSLLGYSGSLAFLLLTGNAAQADPVAPGGELVFTRPVAPQAESTIPQLTVESDPQAQPQVDAIDPNLDAVGDLAITKFRCDCAPCRTAVVQMLQAGQLRL